ncbi:GumC family protein [Amaricoccus sp. W119]|uniref:GumC family protein n=1 Tax=Amaricoccus sp. W119 TaxID=3391833 RepID=UPI0039A75D23
MVNLDLKFYWAVFLRRLPYFLVIVAFLSALGLTVAMLLPPAYTSTGNILVEPQQFSEQVAQSTTQVDPYEQAQIIEQRLMTRANLSKLAERIGLYEGVEPPMTEGAQVKDIVERITFIGFVPDVTRSPGTPGATILGVSFDGPTPEFANKGANELVNLVLEENQKLREGRANETLTFFQAEVQRLADELEKQSEKIARFKTENFEALPDSLEERRQRQILEQERLIALEREESDLRNQRATVIWVFQRTGRSASAGDLSPEEEQLDALQNQLVQQRTIYAADSPRIRMLENQLAALEELVEKQRAARAVPGADGTVKPTSELELELAPIDARLKFIQEDKATIQQSLDDLNASLQATPANEQTLAGLERELANIQNQYNSSVESAGQATVGERIEVMSQGERFSLIQPPATPSVPSSPNRLLIASAGVIGGLGAGLAFVILMEMLNRSIRRPVELTSKLGIQPFATVPYIRTPGEAQRKRMVFGGVLAFVLVVLPITLWLINSYYMPINTLTTETLEKVGVAPEEAELPSGETLEGETAEETAGGTTEETTDGAAGGAADGAAENGTGASPATGTAPDATPDATGAEAP